MSQSSTDCMLLVLTCTQQVGAKKVPASVMRGIVHSLRRYSQFELLEDPFVLSYFLSHCSFQHPCIIMTVVRSVEYLRQLNKGSRAARIRCGDGGLASLKLSNSLQHLRRM